MRPFYQLSPEQQLEKLDHLVRAALPLWNIDVDSQIVLLKYRENAVYAVDSRGERAILRLHRAGYHTGVALRSELQWMAALNESGIKTPDVIPAGNGELFKTVIVEGVPEPRHVDLLGWIEGEALGSVEEGAEGDTDTIISNYRIVGELMAKLHNQAQNWQKPEGFTRHAWDIEGLLGEDPLWGRFWELAELNDMQRDLLQRARLKAQVELERFGKEPDRYGLIHADFLLENLLMCEDGIRLIDFDDCGFGWHLFDIATSLYFLAEEPFFDGVFDAFVEGYRTQRELSANHLALLPTFFLMRALTYLGWLHTRSETETAKELTAATIERAYTLAKDYLGG